MKGTTLFIFTLLISVVLVDAQNATNQTQQNQTPQIMCTQSQCDSECVKCSDKSCHEPGFRCVEELTLEKFFPTTVQYGVNQINIVLDNTGNVKLDDISAAISGDGITTLEQIPLERINVGDRDYVFAKINATKTGTIDIVIKVYVAGNVKHKFAEQITVLEPAKQVQNTTEQINVTKLTSTLDQLRQRYKTTEQEYQNKKSEGFDVDIVYDKLRSAYGGIADTQSALFEGNYNKVKASIEIINDSLNDVDDQLKSATKIQETLSDKIRNNLLLIGSLAAALVSIFTAYKLVQEKINREKILELHQRLSVKKKSKKKAKKH